MQLTQEHLRNILNYEPKTGYLWWKNRVDRTPQWNGRYANTIAGCVAQFERGGPYIVLNIDNKTYLAHRIIWFYIHGCMPSEIDHNDGNGLNNKETNLRPCTSTQNNANRNHIPKGYHKHGRGYKARIKVNGQTIYLGIHDTEEKAAFAYRQAANHYFGDFARHNRWDPGWRRF